MLISSRGPSRRTHSPASASPGRAVGTRGASTAGKQHRWPRAWPMVPRQGQGPLREFLKKIYNEKASALSYHSPRTFTGNLLLPGGLDRRPPRPRRSQQEWFQLARVAPSLLACMPGAGSAGKRNRRVHLVMLSGCLFWQRGLAGETPSSPETVW